MARDDDVLLRLRAALDELAGRAVPELLDQARAEAAARVRATLADAMTDSLLAAAERELSPGAPAAAAPRAASRRAPQSPSPRIPEASTPPPRDAPSGTAWYVYCITSDGDQSLPSGLQGIDPDHPVGVVVTGDLVAVVSQVSLSEFDEERLREHLGDMAWVERVARRHEDVLEAVAAGATIIPMRMCTLYRDERGVLTMLERESRVMHAALDDLRGRAEWGVKVFAGPPPASGTQPDEEPPSSGADYLHRRRREHEERGLEHERLNEALETIFGRLEERAVRAATLPLQRPEMSGHRAEMVLNSVYLVDEADLPEFQGQVAALQDEYAQHGLELGATGPWPAYNFVPDAIGTAS